jgi:hypothetical protein
LQGAQTHVPTLHRQRILDPFILRFCQFYRWKQFNRSLTHSVNTP